MTTTTAQLVTELDLAPYQTYDKYRRMHGLWYREHGLKAAKELGILKLVGNPILLKVPDGIKMDDSFMKALLGPLARKVGPLNLKRDLKVEGGFQGGRARYYGLKPSLADEIESYLESEEQRVQKRAVKKAKDEMGPEWTNPIGFFIPEIGTLVRLEERWEFRLYTERRNDSLSNQLGIPVNRNWRYDNMGINDHDVALGAGTLLTVSRVYIRQGGKEYSSITFNVKKGAKVYRKDTKGNWALHELKKGSRFWAKLSDVNKMKVVVDKMTLAEN